MMKKEIDYKLSVVIPVYLSGKRILKLVDRLYELYDESNLEVVLVNDGSTDDTYLYCEEATRTHENVVYIELRKNYGEHNAVMCGLNHCTGDYVAIIDDDFQNPPEEIEKLLMIADRHDVVYSFYKKKKHHWLRNIGSKINDYVATILLDKPRGLYLSSFKVINRAIIDEIIKYKGPFPYIDGLILRVTSSIGQIEVAHNSRRDGKSNYTLAKLIHLWLNMFINFSIKPMRFLVLAGLAVSAVSLLFAIWIVVEKIINPELITGWASIATLTVLFFGVQFVFLGLIGEYLGKQYLDQNGTPQWAIRKKVI